MKASPDDLREFFEERSAAGLPPAEADLQAGQLTLILARNLEYTWASLRSGLEAYPDLRAQLPDGLGTMVSHARRAQGAARGAARGVQRGA